MPFQTLLNLFRNLAGQGSNLRQSWIHWGQGYSLVLISTIWTALFLSISKSESSILTSYSTITPPFYILNDQ
jgi:hypothetical protein